MKISSINHVECEDHSGVFDNRPNFADKNLLCNWHLLLSSWVQGAFVGFLLVITEGIRGQLQQNNSRRRILLLVERGDFDSQPVLNVMDSVTASLRFNRLYVLHYLYVK